MVFKICYQLRLIENPEVLDISYHGDEGIIYKFFTGSILTPAIDENEAIEKFLYFVGDGDSYEAYDVKYEIYPLRETMPKSKIGLKSDCMCRYCIDGKCILVDEGENINGN